MGGTGGVGILVYFPGKLICNIAERDTEGEREMQLYSEKRESIELENQESNRMKHHFE